jgi:hypothetical protein
LLAPALAATLALAACGASATATGASTRALPGQPCAAATAQTVAGAVSTVATNIYRREAAGGTDKLQVERNEPLLAALAAGNRKAVLAAVTHLVYAGTHIVRLRVTQGGKVLADVGGPYVLAPVRGPLRYHGRTVGAYVLSVQDDVGYVKLETRFIGLPLILMRGSTRLPLPGTIAALPATGEGGTVSYGGASYLVVPVRGEAFPSGALSISVLVPVAAPSSTASCAAVRVREMGALSERIWQRFVLVKAPLGQFIETAPILTGGPVFVRAGSRQLAGSRTPGPSVIPSEGSLRYDGVEYGVASFPAPTLGSNARVYVLVAA